MATAQNAPLVLVSKLAQKGCAVFTPNVQQKLAIANHAIRQLRNEGAVALAVRLDGDVPVITVGIAAASALKRLAYRESYRRLKDGFGTEMIILHDCLVRWSAPETGNGSDEK